MFKVGTISRLKHVLEDASAVTEHSEGRREERESRWIDICVRQYARLPENGDKESLPLSGYERPRY